jgi:hypothetical protein
MFFLSGYGSARLFLNKLCPKFGLVAYKPVSIPPMPRREPFESKDVSYAVRESYAESLCAGCEFRTFQIFYRGLCGFGSEDSCQQARQETQNSVCFSMKDHFSKSDYLCTAIFVAARSSSPVRLSTDDRPHNWCLSMISGLAS